MTRSLQNIALVSLGCPKNLVDSEFLWERLTQAGYHMQTETSTADMVIVNTCAFLNSAVEESIQVMLELLAEGKEVLCCGCLVSRYREELLVELPEITLFAGPGTYDDLPGALRRGLRYLPPRFSGVVSRRLCSTGKSAYVKIAEGCSHHCHYCLIPSLRGELVSKPAPEVLTECAQLARSGVQEIILVAQDLGSYNGDIPLPELVQRIADLEGICWVRLMYMHPASLTRGLVEVIATHDKVCPYIDLPIQHVCETVLKTMGRRGGAAAVRGALEMLRGHAIWIRSTVMVGHPGEDERAFSELEDLISEGYIDHLGVFAYSEEDGTVSAQMPPSVSDDLKTARREHILALQQEISRSRLAGLQGRRIPVFIEGYHPETDLLLCGRADFQAPEVDGLVIINEGSAPFGSICTVEIVDTMEYDLIGRIV